MTQQATVIKLLDGGMAQVQVTRRSACGDNCAHCPSKCGEALGKVLVDAENAAGAAAGDRVELYSSTKKVLSIAALVYLVPVLLFLAAVLLTTWAGLKNGLCALISVLAFLLGIVFAVIYQKKAASARQLSYKIVKILK